MSENTGELILFSVIGYAAILIGIACLAFLIVKYLKVGKKSEAFQQLRSAYREQFDRIRDGGLRQNLEGVARWLPVGIAFGWLSFAGRGTGFGLFLIGSLAFAFAAFFVPAVIKVFSEWMKRAWTGPALLAVELLLVWFVWLRTRG